jgi:hypothetical protein
VAVISAVAIEALLNFAACLEKFAGVCKSIKLDLNADN